MVASWTALAVFTILLIVSLTLAVRETRLYRLEGAVKSLQHRLLEAKAAGTCPSSDIENLCDELSSKQPDLRGFVERGEKILSKNHQNGAEEVPIRRVVVEQD